MVPRACQPYRAKTKGKVERPFRYIRQDFFLARTFRNMDDLNAQFDIWRAEVATALLDRLLHHAVVIQIEGASYRLRAHADLIPEHVRANAPITPPPPPKRRGRPPKAKNGAADH